MTSRPRKPSAEARLAEIRKTARAFGYGWCNMPTNIERAFRRIYRLTAPARGRKKR